MMRKLGGKLFAPVFFIAVMAMMLILRPDPSLTGSQLNSINGVFLSEDWIEESSISREIKEQTEGLPLVQQSVFMRQLDDEQPFHVVHLSGETFAETTGIERAMGDSYTEVDDPADHEDPYAKGLSTVTPDEDDLPEDEWGEFQNREWSEFPAWVEGLKEPVESHYGKRGVMDITTIHPDETARVIEYTRTVEEFRRAERDEVRVEEMKEEIEEAENGEGIMNDLEDGEEPQSDLDHGPMPIYEEITRDVRRMSPDVVLLDLDLVLDHMEVETYRVEGVQGFSPDDILDQTFTILNNLHRGNVDHFTTYILFSDDVRDRLGLTEQSALPEDLRNLASQFRIYDDQQIVHLIEIDAYEDLRPAWWSQSQISPLLTGE